MVLYVCNFYVIPAKIAGERTRDEKRCQRILRWAAEGWFSHHDWGLYPQYLHPERDGNRGDDDYQPHRADCLHRLCLAKLESGKQTSKAWRCGKRQYRGYPRATSAFLYLALVDDASEFFGSFRGTYWLLHQSGFFLGYVLGLAVWDHYDHQEQPISDVPDGASHHGTNSVTRKGSCGKSSPFSPASLRGKSFFESKNIKNL